MRLQGSRAVAALLLCAAGCAPAAIAPDHPDPRRPELDLIEAAVEGSPDGLDGPRERLDRVLESEPSHHRSLLLRARILLGLSRPREALADLERIAALYAPEPEATALRGKALLELRRPAEARRTLRQALDLDPRNVTALSTLGRLLAENGVFPEASKYLRRARDFAPDSAGIRTLQAALDAAAAEGPLSRSLEPAQLRMAARFRMGAGAAKEATDVLLDALRGAPDDAALLREAARGLSLQGIDRHAEPLLARAAALRPRDPGLLYELATVCARLGARDPGLLARAIRHFEAASTLSARDPRPLHASAGLHARTGDLAGAARLYEAARKIDPADPDLASDHGLFVLRGGDAGRALDLFDQALARHPDHPVLQANRMTALFKLGRLKDGAAAQERLAARQDLPPDLRQIVDRYSGASK